MNKNEFLAKLKEALVGNLSSQKVEEHVAFYNQYIDEEVRKGRMESEVITELGDPWVIARNILSTPGSSNHVEYVYEETDKGFERTDSASNNIKVFQLDSWWKKALLLAAVLTVLCVIFSVITGILKLVMPIAIPVIAIMLIVKIWKK